MVSLVRALDRHGAGAHTPAACSFPGENARSWEALGEARPGQSSLSAGALRYRVRGCVPSQEPCPVPFFLPSTCLTRPGCFLHLDLF